MPVYDFYNFIIIILLTFLCPVPYQLLPLIIRRWFVLPFDLVMYIYSLDKLRTALLYRISS